MKEIIWKKISKFGKKLVEYDFVYSHLGNISVKVANKILITRTGCMLDEITENDIIKVDLNKASNIDVLASSETIVHRSIYNNTNASAIIHIHSPFAVIESILTKTNQIIPITYEGRCLIDKIPLVTGPCGSRELAQNASRALKNTRCVILKEHGSIAIGNTLEEAYINICSIEYNCKIKYFIDLMKK